MEYNFYLEQRYMRNGTVECRILDATEAERLGYEDDVVLRGEGACWRVYINGFDTREGARLYFEDLTDAVMVDGND